MCIFKKKQKIGEFSVHKEKKYDDNEISGYALPKACVNCVYYNPMKIRFGKKWCNYYKVYCNQDIMNKGCDHYIPYK